MSNENKLVDTSRVFDDKYWRGIRSYEDRIQPVRECCKDLNVLNIGCTGSDVLFKNNTVHSQISQVAKYLHGIDINEDGIDHLKRGGFNVSVANAENFQLEIKNFDIAILGDVIEHVSNPGLVFDSVFNHLKPGGMCLVTTPNPHAFGVIVRRLLNFKYQVNDEHVCWFDPYLLSFLMARSGFSEFSLFYSDVSKMPFINVVQHFFPKFRNNFGLIAIKSLSR